MVDEQVGTDTETLGAQTGHLGIDVAATDGKVVLRLESFHVVSRYAERKRATVDEGLAVELVCSILGYGNVDAVAAGSADADGAAVHLEVLLDVHSVAHRRSDVELAKSGLEEGVFIRSIGVLGLSGEVERAASLKFGMSVDEEAGFLLSAGTVGKGGHTTLGQHHGDALAVFDADGCAVGVGQVEVVQKEGGLVLAVHPERTVR